MGMMMDARALEVEGVVAVDATPSILSEGKHDRTIDNIVTSTPSIPAKTDPRIAGRPRLASLTASLPCPNSGDYGSAAIGGSTSQYHLLVSSAIYYSSASYQSVPPALS